MHVISQIGIWPTLITIFFSSGILAGLITLFFNYLRERSNNNTLAIKSLRLLLITIYEQEDFSERIKNYFETKVQIKTYPYTFFGESIHSLNIVNDLISNINLNLSWNWFVRALKCFDFISYFCLYVKKQQSIPNAYFISIRNLNIANSAFITLKKRLEFLNRNIEAKQNFLNSLPNMNNELKQQIFDGVNSEMQEIIKTCKDSIKHQLAAAEQLIFLAQLLYPKEKHWPITQKIRVSNDSKTNINEPICTTS